MPVIVPDYHLGVVVSDLHRAMAELTDLLGLRWLPPVRSGHQVTGDGPPHTGPMLTMSRQGPPYLELLELTPGTVWSEPGLHHLGFWAHDVRAESARMTAAGFPLEAEAVVLAGDTEPGVCYHRTSDGLRLELVEMSRGGPALAHYLNAITD
ncbi:VOC family protein [Crossiella cryophila]|uniref:Catechol 2,3-dioxygenase-like lactoylglutathione lyase family enzyme n=1 Tax=Crossiella cryophila TaxID=43355 RepID=A0A7W7CF87_9PSEU|nr:VOC family protein [Crossiella cryophila]MBB4678693.1 catechol 2,3-dioxygenase-like lactoylglutathione lyase family enzyme [Crossiella cryophila]